jgi:hypothetical protein
VVLVALLVGALGFVVTQTGDDAEPVTTGEASDDPEPVQTPPPTGPMATGSVDGAVVHLGAFGEVVDEADLQSTLERIGLTQRDDPVATADPVLNL